MKLCVIFLSGVLATSCHVFPNTIRWRSNGISEEAEKLSGIELVEYVNKAQSLFKANFSSKFAQYPSPIKRKLMGVKKIEVPVEYRISEKTNPDINEATIPASFDARQQWPYCPSIKFIRDQSSCGSCWAFGAAEAMTDRYCIASQGKEQITISADDIMSCCGFTCGDGCNGGYPIQAWHYWVKHGIVSGGNYTSKDGCKPYPYPPCEHHNNSTHYEPCPGDIYPTNKCQKLCQSGYPISYNNDKHYGKSAYAVSRKVAEIQKEIMTHGPVEVSYNVYEDFEHYSGGIYVHTAGEMLGGHAVKMIGWGVENGTPYWICSNSWNSDWGENGFFRIIRGLNECGIESGVVAGEPKF